ncbi:DUF3775 domain-containing protein [Oceanicaulis alexandrii]|uniref:DUF3775 domain-containing protein n=1 Tax=Oceanicaulis alexandrii TaxID=153233 RepID=UPI0003B3EA70|nr:DUF3775 domain-containing protein [Oceanicaulis alexandrii]
MPEAIDDDPFFSLTDDSTWNACIGVQAYDENYVDGFTDAALLLAETVIKEGMFGSRDTIVFPILYNARHGIELTLKYLIKRLSDADVIRGAPRVDHDILAHWQFLMGQPLGDETLRQLLASLEPFILSLSNIDDDGQSFRYSETRDGQMSMGERSLASVEVIRDSLRELRNILEGLKYRLWDIEEERKTGTFTAECSRLDLKVIAEAMPDRANWNSDKYTEARAAMMNRFDLSGRKFSDALTKLQESRELNQLIGEPRQLFHLTDEHAELVIKQWCRLHPNRESKGDIVGIDYLQRSHEEMVARREEEREVYANLLEALSNDEIADIDTLFYMGRDVRYGEHYEAMLEANKREHDITNDRMVSLSHVLSKTSFAHELAKGLDRVGRSDLAEHLRKFAEPS